MSPSGQWGWTRREGGVDALAEWIDQAQKRNPTQRWGLWGGIVGGTGGILGGALGVILGSSDSPPHIMAILVPIALWLGLAIGLALRIFKQIKLEEGAWSRESRGLMTKMYVARWHGNLKQALGEEGAERMNEAAKVLLQCQSTLDSPAWKAASGSQLWSEIREKAIRSMDAAMARMLLLVMSGASSQETASILQDMKDMHDEVNRASKRHSQISGIPMGGAEGLRQTLAEMRELANADEEFLAENIQN